MLKDPFSQVAEAYQMLRVKLEIARFEKPLHTLLVTSSSPGEGKSTTAANLALAIARSGKRVILVDTDLRRPSLHRFFRHANLRGVTTALVRDPSDSLYNQDDRHRSGESAGAAERSGSLRSGGDGQFEEDARPDR